MSLKNVLFEIPGFVIQIRGTFLGGSLWFLPCLFVTEIIFYFIIKITKNNKVKILFSIAICALVGSIYFKCINKLLPWSVDAALTAIFFLGIGYLSKNTKKKFDKIVDIRIAILLLIINVCSTYFNYKILGSNVDLYACKQGNVLLYYIESISGIYMCISIKRLIKSSNILISIGKNSLIYYCLHGSLFVIFRSIISNFTSIENCNFIKSLVIGITMIVLAVIIIWNISDFINKKCPFILGKINICNDDKVWKRKKYYIYWKVSVARENNYETVNLLDKIDREVYSVDASELIWLINNVQLMCTDSFHGVVFFWKKAGDYFRFYILLNKFDIRCIYAFYYFK